MLAVRLTNIRLDQFIISKEIQPTQQLPVRLKEEIKDKIVRKMHSGINNVYTTKRLLQFFQIFPDQKELLAD